VREAKVPAYKQRALARKGVPQSRCCAAVPGVAEQLRRAIEAFAKGRTPLRGDPGTGEIAP